MSFADTMVAKYEALLQASVGVKSITADGMTVTYAELEKQYDYWKRRQARASGRRPTFSQIDLRNT